MLEQLAADATRAVMLAQGEARRLGRNYVDTEILLLGLIAVCEGLAGRSSASLRESLKAARKALESVIGRGSDFVTRDPPFTATAEKVIKAAIRKAPRGKNANCETIFRALLSEADCDAVHVLQSLSIDCESIADCLKRLNDDPAEPELPSWQLAEMGLPTSREQALSNVFGLNSFIKKGSVPPEMLGWFDEKDTILGVYVNAEDDLIVIGDRGICWYDGEAKTYIEYRSIDSVDEPADADDPYLKLVLRPKGKVVMLPVLHSTEDVPDYEDFYHYLSFCTKPKVNKMDIQDIESKDDLAYFLRQPNVQCAGFDELANWLQSGGPKPAWLEPLKIAPELLNDPSVWRLFALLLVRVPKAIDTE